MSLNGSEGLRRSIKPGRNYPYRAIFWVIVQFLAKVARYSAHPEGLLRLNILVFVCHSCQWAGIKTDEKTVDQFPAKFSGLVFPLLSDLLFIKVIIVPLVDTLW